jgi:predicted nucleotidyltransferase
MKTKIKNINQINKIITDYFNTQEDISAVYLFGSYAEGHQQPTSDIDLGILFDSHDRQFIYRKMDEHYLALSRMLRKDLHLVALNTSGELLLKQVFSKGQCLLEKKPRKLAEFQMVAYSKIADFGYYQKLCEKGFVSKLLHD